MRNIMVLSVLAIGLMSCTDMRPLGGADNGLLPGEISGCDDGDCGAGKAAVDE